MRLRSHLVALVFAASCHSWVSPHSSSGRCPPAVSVTKRGMRETAQAVARTVDKELETATTTLEALGGGGPLDAASLA